MDLTRAVLFGIATLALAPTAASAAPDPIAFANALTTTTLTSTIHSLVSFEPGRARVYSAGRERIQLVVERLRHEATVAELTLHAYADGRDLGVAQRRAYQVQRNLVKYGFPAARIRVVLHAASDLDPRETDRRRVDLVVTRCDRVAGCAAIADRH